MSAHDQFRAERNIGPVAEQVDSMPADMQYETIAEGTSAELTILVPEPVEPGIIDLAPKVLVGAELHPSFTAGELSKWFRSRAKNERDAARRLDSKRHLGLQATTGTLRPNEGSVEDTEATPERKDPRIYMADKGARASREEVQAAMTIRAAHSRSVNPRNKRSGW